MHETRMTVAQKTTLAKATVRLRSGLRKAESSLAFQIRAEKIGLRAYLHSRGVPGVDSLRCECGHGRQTAKHIIRFCPRWNELRLRIYSAGPNGSQNFDYRDMLASLAGRRRAARLLTEIGLLQQFEASNPFYLVRCKIETLNW